MNRTNQISANVVSYVIVVLLLGSLLASKSYAETCVGTSPRFCVDFTNGGNPEFPDDFDVSGDNLILRTGALNWRVWSQVSASDTTPADFGSITLNPTVPADNFEVEIKNGTTGGAGAANVGSIVLDDAGFTGYSNLGATTIDGHVTGAITLVDDGGMPPQGGEVTGVLFIGYGILPEFGGVVGPITISKVSAHVAIAGDYGNASLCPDIDIGVIANNSGITIAGDIRSDCNSVQAIDVGSIGNSSDSTGGSFTVHGSFTNSKAIVTIGMPTITDVASGVLITGDFGGVLHLVDGVPEENTVTIQGSLLSPVSGDGGKVKLNNKDIAGTLILGDAQSDTEILNGGQVTGILYPSQFGGDFAGTATFTGVAAGAQIYAFGSTASEAHISGDFIINGDYAGLFKIDGDFTSTASLTINGDLEVSSGEDGLIWIVEEAAGDITIKQDLIGHVHYPKTFATNGSLTVEGNVTSRGLFKTGDLATGETHDGDLIFQGNVVGDILIHGNMSGDVTTTLDQSGDLVIDEI